MTRKNKHIGKFLAPTQSRDNPANLFMFMFFSFPDTQGILLSKNTTESEFRYGEKFGTDEAKRYGEGSQILVLLGKGDRKTVQKVKNYGGSKILRIRAPYNF